MDTGNKLLSTIAPPLADAISSSDVAVVIVAWPKMEITSPLDGDVGFTRLELDMVNKKFARLLTEIDSGMESSSPELGRSRNMILSSVIAVEEI
jgi:hypothetical protein